MIEYYIHYSDGRMMLRLNTTLTVHMRDDVVIEYDSDCSDDGMVS